MTIGKVKRSPDQVALKENGGVLANPAVPARALLRADQGHPHGNCIGASIRWTRSRAWQ